MIKHSIITWDSCFRNFFHLIGSLVEQDYDLSTVEFIFIEQRTKEKAQVVADAFSVRSFAQTIENLDTALNMELVFLDEPDSEPYHPGRLLNEGLKRAKGEILSTMDVDILVPPYFLRVLDIVHEQDPVIACMHRYQADRPCGVSFENWTKQIINYDLVLNICPNRNNPIPAVINNKAPLLSTRRKYWDSIGGYDPHLLFSTAYTLFGRDISMRFKLLLGDVELALPIACVHPWHPTEVNRSQEKINILYQAQQAAIEWSANNQCYDVAKRQELAENIYLQHQQPIEEAIIFAEESMRASTRG